MEKPRTNPIKAIFDVLLLIVLMTILVSLFTGDFNKFMIYLTKLR